MSLMRWFRKNNRKIMAIAVVGLMVVFIGGSALRMSCSYSGPQPKKAVYLFGKNNEISRQDLMQAEAELSILKSLKMDMVLRSRGIGGIFLSELLFSEGAIPPQLLNALQQGIRNQNLRISDEEILSLYKKTERNGVYWHLLKEEAANAGIAISNETAKSAMQQLVPNLFQGASYANVMNSFIGRRISEEDVLSTFANAFAILEHARFICSNESLTRTQISHLTSNELETLSTELVRFPAELFTNKKTNITEQQITNHFEKYKSYFPKEITEDNPYGFGYKLDDRVQLEYVMVKLDDIKKIIEQPTQQDKEKFYLSHTSEFTRQVPVDPNDPNSATIAQTRSFGEVARFITNQLISERINNEVNVILGKAKQLAEEKYSDTDIADMTAEQLKSNSVDFSDIAKKLSQENPVEIYSGKTGLLSVADIQRDKYLIGLYIKPTSAGQMPNPLVQVVFSVEQLDDSNNLAYGMTAKPKLYETLGPLNDLQGQVAALVRIVDAQESSEPSGIEVILKAATINLDEDEMTEEEKAVTVRQQVEENLKTLAAMQTAKENADKFIPLAQEQGWDEAIEKYNKQYPPIGPDDPNNFDMTVWSNFKRPSAEVMEILTAQSKGLPGKRLNMNVHNKDMKILQGLFSLVPEDSNVPDKLPVVVEVKPDFSYYCIEKLSVKRIDSRQYDQAKAMLAFRQDTAENQYLNALYFLPRNITMRANLRLAAEMIQPAEPNEPNDKTMEDM